MFPCLPSKTGTLAVMMFLRHGHTLRHDQVIVCLELRPSPEQRPANEHSMNALSREGDCVRFCMY